MEKDKSWIEELTIEEKASLLSGHKSWFTNQISRLNSQLTKSRKDGGHREDISNNFRMWNILQSNWPELFNLI